MSIGVCLHSLSNIDRTKKEGTIYVNQESV